MNVWLVIWSELDLGTSRRTKSSVFLNIVQTAFDPPLPPSFWTFMLRIILRIILPNSVHNYTKSATKFFEHGFDPLPPLNNVKKKQMIWYRGSSLTKLSVFFNIVQTAFDPPPPLVLNIYVADFSKGLLKKWVNACRDKCVKTQNSA